MNIINGKLGLVFEMIKDADAKITCATKNQTTPTVDFFEPITDSVFYPAFRKINEAIDNNEIMISTFIPREKNGLDLDIILMPNKYLKFDYEYSSVNHSLIIYAENHKKSTKLAEMVTTKTNDTETIETKHHYTYENGSVRRVDKVNGNIVANTICPTEKTLDLY